MKTKFIVVYGTEENGFEPEIENCNTAEEASNFALDIAEEIENEGYESFVRICANDTEYKNAITEIEDFRAEWLEENF